MTKKIRILIADDHPIVRQGLAVVLAVQPDMELVACTATARFYSHWTWNKLQI